MSYIDIMAQFPKMDKIEEDWQKIQFKCKGCKFCMHIEMFVVLYWFSVWMIIWLAGTNHEEADSIHYAAEISVET